MQIPVAKKVRATILAVSQHTDVSLCMMMGDSTKRHVTYARQLAWLILVDIYEHATTYLAHVFDCDSSSIREALIRMRERTDSTIKTHISSILQSINNDSTN
jgi:chromosomal replication initiation ATPase DnaA